MHNPWTSFFQNRNCSLSALTFRPLAGFLLTICMSIQTIIAINAPVSRLLVAGLASRLFERLSSVCPFPVGTEKDACSSPSAFACYSRLVWGWILLCFSLLPLMSLGFPWHANLENYKSLLLNKTHLPSTKSTLLSSAWWKNCVPFLQLRPHAL